VPVVEFINHRCLALLQAVIGIYWYRSQTHRVVEVGREALEVSWSSPLLKQGHPGPRPGGF